MPIEFHCSTCRSLLRIPDSTSGKWISCPNCGSTNPHPASAPASKPDFSTPSKDHYPNIQTTNPYGAPSPSHGYATPELTRQAIVSRTQPAAIVWLVLAILNSLFALLAVFSGFLSIAEVGMVEEDLIGLIFCGVVLIFGIIGITGAVCMLRMRYHTFCIIATVATMISSILCCLVPSGAAIWAIVVLLLPGTRHFFAKQPSSY